MRLRPLLWMTVLGLLATPLAPAGAEAQTKLLRFPDLHGDRVVFCYAGDLWLAPAEGGSAWRLTSHPGRELFPKFSPDGAWVAFTGQYDGDEQVYVIPTAGGEPRQLTFYPARGPLSSRWGFDNQVYGWTGDSQAVLFRSLREGWDLSDSRLYTVPLDGGLPTALAMPVSGAGDLAPDGRRAVYSPLFRDFRTWKRYQGGWASDLWIFDLETNEATPITDHPRSDRDPMWIENTIVFSSDRTGTLNLYAYDVESGSTEALTREEEWDIRWPSAAEDRRVVYEKAGALEIFSLDDGTSRPIDVFVPDDKVPVRPTRVDASGLVEDFELSPRGERALFVARGDVFSAPIEKGPTRNLTRSPGAHDRAARWSPDGAQVAFISDASGEDEIWIVPQDGSGEPRQLTDGRWGMLFAPKWSPNGRWIAFCDKEGRIRLVEVETKRLRDVADEPYGRSFDYAWSPRGGYLALTLSDRNEFRSLYVYDVADDELHRITGEMFNEFDPAWGVDGDYLYYMADRSYAPQVGAIEWNYVLDRETFLYALALRKDVSHPFPPESDEVEIAAEDEASAEDGDEEAEDEGPIAIDFDGLAERVARVPVDADNYGGLVALEGHLLFGRGSSFFYGRDNDPEPEIRLFSLQEREVSTLASGTRGFAVSHDGKKLLTREGGSYWLYDVKKDAKGSRKQVSTSGLKVDRVPREEWVQIFEEVWRRYRDFFYVENMHGYDWEALREQYRPLLEHVAHRYDLNYVIGEMIAELNVSHAYNSGGDIYNPERPRVALPGATLVADPESGRYRIGRIYEGHNEEDRYRSPLTEIGIDARPGDYLLAIDGEALTTSDNPYRRLRHKADRPVTLLLNDRPREEGAREIVYHPISNEIPLRYFNWVAERRRRVEEATDGRIGYLHIPDMGSSGLREFVKWFYGQIRKEGLVIDVRGNGGGNVSQMLIERLRREMLRVRFVRTYEWPLSYPSSVFHGHLVCLLNETSASDGDVFPAMFRRAGLGPLIGKRSWGGVTGITGYGPLIDGGSCSVPQYGTNSLEGEWIIEGHGVDPDIEVENTPASIIAGEDRQLERAIEEVLERVRREPKRFPPRPDPPVRTQ